MPPPDASPSSTGLTDPEAQPASRGERRGAWTMLLVAIVLLFCTGPGQTVGVSVFVDHLIDDLDLTRSQVSTAYLIGTLTGAVAMPLTGRFIDRRGVRTAALIVLAGFSLVLAGMAAVAGFITLAIGFAGTRGFGQGALSLISTTTVAVWFERSRGTAVGLLSAVGGAAMALVPIIGAVLISAWGWRTAWIAMAIGVAAIGLPLTALVLRDPRSTVASRRHVAASTADAGDADDAARDADQETAGDRTATASAVRPGQHLWTTNEVMRHRAFWAMLAASSAAGMLSTALVFHQLDLLGARGLTSTQAAANFLPQTLAAAGGALLTGRLVDRIAPRRLLPVALILLAAPNVFWHLVSPGVTAITYGVLIGLAGSSIRTLEAASLPLWYGTASIGEIRGIVQTSNVAATALGPIALSLGRDAFGSYGATLAGLTAIPLGLAVFALFVQPPPSAPIPAHGSTAATVPEHADRRHVPARIRRRS